MEVDYSEQDPQGLSNEAMRLWSNGVPGAEVREGDLWVLSWDRRTKGHALITSMFSDYVLVWPVTLPHEAQFIPGLVVPSSPLGVPLTVWPTRETGIGLHLLDRALGPLIDRESMRGIAIAMEEGRDPGLPFAEGSHDWELDESRVAHWAGLCFHHGAEAEGMYLDQKKLRDVGAASRSAGEALGLDPASLRELWTGMREATEAQVYTLASMLGVEPDAITAPPPTDVLAELARPDYKRLLTEKAEQLGVSERDVRLQARAEFALAARNDDEKSTTRKLRDAIGRIGR